MPEKGNKSKEDTTSEKDNKLNIDGIEPSQSLLDDDTKVKVDVFTTEYLKQDGAFLLRLIAHNTDKHHDHRGDVLALGTLEGTS